MSQLDRRPLTELGNRNSILNSKNPASILRSKNTSAPTTMTVTTQSQNSTNSSQNSPNEPQRAFHTRSSGTSNDKCKFIQANRPNADDCNDRLITINRSKKMIEDVQLRN